MRSHRLFLILAVPLVIGLVVTFQCSTGRFSYWNYMRVQPGMPIAEVEAILGAGEETSVRWIPHTRTGPVVVGERYFRWQQDHRKIVISFDNGQVVGKWYWEPSF